MRLPLRLGLFSLTAVLVMAQASPEDEEEEGSYQEQEEPEDEAEESEGPADDDSSEESESPAPAPQAPTGGKAPAAGTKGKPAAPTSAPPPPKPPEIGLDYQMKAWAVVNASSGAIDTCLDKYLEFQPTAVGTVDLGLDISGDGRVLKVSTKSGLPGSEKVQQCLKFIAQSWKFPTAEGVAKFSTSLQIKVQKGQKFTLSKPGEKPAEKKAAAVKGDSGFLGFTPTFGTGYYQ
jgi:hypothetical protein